MRMAVIASLWLVAKWLLLIAGLLGPGAALMRALRVPLSIAGSFCGSAAALYVTVLALQLVGGRIGLASIATGLVVLSGVALFVAHFAGDNAIARFFGGGPASVRAVDDTEVVPPRLGFVNKPCIRITSSPADIPS